VEQQQPLGEDVARYIAHQLTASVAYLHSKVRCLAAGTAEIHRLVTRAICLPFLHNQHDNRTALVACLSCTISTATAQQ
jgi:hypothetical protein